MPRLWLRPLLAPLPHFLELYSLLPPGYSLPRPSEILKLSGGKAPVEAGVSLGSVTLNLLLLAHLPGNPAGNLL